MSVYRSGMHHPVIPWRGGKDAATITRRAAAAAAAAGADGDGDA